MTKKNLFSLDLQRNEPKLHWDTVMNELSCGISFLSTSFIVNKQAKILTVFTRHGKISISTGQCDRHGLKLCQNKKCQMFVGIHRYFKVRSSYGKNVVISKQE